MAYIGICFSSVVAISFVNVRFPITLCSLRYEEGLCVDILLFSTGNQTVKNVYKHFSLSLVQIFFEKPASSIELNWMKKFR